MERIAVERQIPTIASGIGIPRPRSGLDFGRRPRVWHCEVDWAFRRFQSSLLNMAYSSRLVKSKRYQKCRYHGVSVRLLALFTLLFTLAFSVVALILRKGASPLKTCMLFPVHEPHFEYARRRLHLTYHFSRGLHPHTVVVFDDRELLKKFESSQTMSTIPWEYVHLLSLEDILDESDFTKTMSFLREQGTEALFHENTTCEKRTRGRVFQAIKKLYAPLYSPEHCQNFWVSDAESWPFRPYDFSELVRLNIDKSSGKPIQLISSWHKEAACRNFEHDIWTDTSCATLIQSHLHFDSYWDESSPNASALGLKLGQTYVDVNNWWFYDPEAIKNLHGRVLRVTKASVADSLMKLRVADIAFWTQYLQHTQTCQGPQVHLRNFPDTLKAKFPKVYNECCLCYQGTPPCYDLPVLFSECFMSRVTTEDITAFIVEELGIFGFWGDISNEIPEEVFRDKRISWIVNNADRWRASDKFIVME